MTAIPVDYRQGRAGPHAGRRPRQCAAWARVMTGALALAFGLLAANGAAARTAFEILCEDEISQAAAVVSTQQKGYRIDNNLSYKALSTIKGAARANTYLLGLTKTEVRIGLEVDGPMLTDPETDGECIAPVISVSLSYAPIVIYVASEFEPGTCSYDEILTHELRHMQLYLDHLPKAEAVVRDALTARFQGKPMYAPRGSVKPALAREISAVWKPFIRDAMGKVETEQAAIDSEEEYAHLSRMCGGEMRHVIKGLRWPR